VARVLLSLKATLIHFLLFSLRAHGSAPDANIQQYAAISQLPWTPKTWATLFKCVEIDDKNGLSPRHHCTALMLVLLLWSSPSPRHMYNIWTRFGAKHDWLDENLLLCPTGHNFVGSRVVTSIHILCV